MAVQTIRIADLTARCQNFRNYLTNNLKVDSFGHFVGAATFSIEQLQSMINGATDSGATPAYVRVYYGCDGSEGNHELFMTVLDAEENVIQNQDAATAIQADSNPQSTATPAEPATTFIAQAAKCPPGCTRDRIIGGLINA